MISVSVHLNVFPITLATIYKHIWIKFSEERNVNVLRDVFFHVTTINTYCRKSTLAALKMRSIFIFYANVFCFAFQKTFKDEELLPLQLVLKKLDLISELRERWDFLKLYLKCTVDKKSGFCDVKKKEITINHVICFTFNVKSLD